MWHLRSSDETIGRLFSTMEDVTAFVLNYNTWMSWKLDFIPKWEAAAPRPPSDVAKPEAARPVPMSSLDF